MHVQLLSGIRTPKLCLNLYLQLLQHIVTYHPTLNVLGGKTHAILRECCGSWLGLLPRRIVSRVLSHNAILTHLRIGLRTHRTERKCHGIKSLRSCYAARCTTATQAFDAIALPWRSKPFQIRATFASRFANV